MDDQPAPRLNRRALAVLRFVSRHIAERGYPPSFREIIDGTDLESTYTVHWYLGALAAAGCLERDSGVSRGLRVTEAGAALVAAEVAA